jgi:hypothetical protein
MTVATDSAPAGTASPAGEMRLDQQAGPLLGSCLAQHRQLQYEVSRYIELLLAELGTMARAADLKHLLHFIEMTRQEAVDQTKRCDIDR